MIEGSLITFGIMISYVVLMTVLNAETDATVDMYVARIFCTCILNSWPTVD